MVVGGRVGSSVVGTCPDALGTVGCMDLESTGYDGRTAPFPASCMATHLETEERRGVARGARVEAVASLPRRFPPAYAMDDDVGACPGEDGVVRAGGVVPHGVGAVAYVEDHDAGRVH